MIHHIVLFKLSLEDELKAQQIAIIREKLESLPEHINELKEIQIGININTKEEYDFMLHAVLEKEEHIDIYAQHPKHLEIVANLIKPYLVNRACVDILV